MRFMMKLEYIQEIFVIIQLKKPLSFHLLLKVIMINMYKTILVTCFYGLGSMFLSLGEEVHSALCV
jgi:hypothetical protein